ncbi:inositol monophosphatase family protein [Actinoallomurus vinaceus]|uniref:Inositol monophosphatase family protein n=1 Tax=Actinoallomurus vinaceus TaxID=1080074 RepID=A0ABP8UB68_9ACTN
MDLWKARIVAIEAAEAAGTLLRRGACGRFDVREKGAADVLTSLDLESERVIVERIRAGYPRHRIISEELGVIDGDDAWSWVIDPLDGTNNLAIGLPVYGIGLALCHDGVPMLGVIHDPVSDRTWSAIRGRGAWISRNRALSRPADRRRRRPLLAWSQGYAVSPDDPMASALRLLLERMAGRVLQLWAPLTYWVMLARGDIDGIVGYRIGEVDLHAGVVIAREVGIDIRDLSGAPFEERLGDMSETRSLVAGPEDVVDRLLRLGPPAERLRTRLADLWTAERAVAHAPEPPDWR